MGGGGGGGDWLLPTDNDFFIEGTQRNYTAGVQWGYEFTADEALSVKATRLKLTNNEAVQTGTVFLWDQETQGLLASVAVVASPDPGWSDTFSFSAPIPLTEGKTYVVSWSMEQSLTEVLVCSNASAVTQFAPSPITFIRGRSYSNTQQIPIGQLSDMRGYLDLLV